MNRRQDKRLIIVETAIYRVFSDLEFSSKNLNRTVLGLCDRLERVFSCQRRYRKLSLLPRRNTSVKIRSRHRQQGSISTDQKYFYIHAAIFMSNGHFGIVQASHENNIIHPTYR
ncbi:MAG: hypothetical protein V7K77_13410 [Nostoc sp.]|uniref:hypothetical protein n=1 Tax=Nostoc sp. TaxID=1180 RepID=UPI002FF85C8E